jgi:solute carrier family 13 (sodium-dependent dicarboxylate transporter), member 2/3/5
MTAATGLMPVGRRQPHIAAGQFLVASIGAALALAVALGSGPSNVDAEARRTLAITVLGLGLWGAFPQRAFWPSILVIGLVLVSRTIASPSNLVGQVIQLYGTSGVWTPLTGFVLAHAVAVSGLGRRVAFAVVRRVGRRPSLIVLAVGIASLLIAPLSPSTTAKAFLLLPICVGLVEAYGAKPGSRFGAATLLFAAAANNIGASMFLTATIPNFISSQYLASVGVEVSWLHWLVLAGPPNLLLLIFAWIALLVVRRPESSVGESVVAVRAVLAREATPVSRAEIATAMALALALVLWVSEPLTGLNGGLIGLAVAGCLFLPPIRAIRLGALGDTVPRGPVALFFAALLLGSAITASAAFDPIVRSVFESLGIDRLPLMPAVGVVIVVALLGHLVFTSTTAYATVIVPIALAMAAAGGLPPATLALPVAITIGYAFMLPMNTVPNVIMLEAGYFSAREMLGFGTILTLAAAAILLLLAVPYWQVLGVFGG